MSKPTILKAKPVLRYSGGKSKMLKKLIPLLPSSFDHYLEPFVGAGSMFFYVKNNNLAQTYTINDADHELINFYNCFQDGRDVDTYIRFLEELLPLSVETKKETFYRYKAAPFVFPYMYFFINRCAFGGNMTGGFSKHAAEHRFTQSSIDRLKPLREFFKGVRISCADYSDVILHRDVDDAQPIKSLDTFAFVDPPYYGIKGLYSVQGNGEFDHARLYYQLNHCRNMIMLTYNDHPWVRGTYKNWNITEIPVTYGENQSGKGKRAVELVIRNYQ